MDKSSLIKAEKNLGKYFYFTISTFASSRNSPSS